DPADAPLGEGLELLHGEGRLEACNHALEEATVQRAHQLPVLVDEIPERARPQRDLDGAGALAPEPRLEARLRHGLLQHRQVSAGREFGPRLRAPASDEVLPPLPRQAGGALDLALAPEQS